MPHADKPGVATPVTGNEADEISDASLALLSQRIDAVTSLKDQNKAGNPPFASASPRMAELAGGLIAGAAVGGVPGYYADAWLGTSPLGIVLGVSVGFAAAVYNLIKVVKDIQ